jgi:hypothetical protein
MAKYIFVAQFDCSDKTREAEFIEWMDNVHVPEILKAPGIVGATRYVNIDPVGTKRPEYVNIFEIEIDDINRFFAAFKKINKERETAGTIIDTIVPETAYPFSAPIYKQVMVYRVPPRKK